MPSIGEDSNGLVQALFDFEAKPGRFAIALREPRILFDGGHAVLTLACGRPIPGMGNDGVVGARIEQAARFFVRTAMLRQGSDPYTVLGLPTAFDAAQLRDHYRMLMRLTHPDFAGTERRGWPADAATRINLAHDVLSSPVRRREYDQAAAAKATFRMPSGVSSSAFRARPVPLQEESGLASHLRQAGRAARGSFARVTRSDRPSFALSPVLISSLMAAIGASALTAWLLAGREPTNVAVSAVSPRPDAPGSIPRGATTSPDDAGVSQRAAQVDLAAATRPTVANAEPTSPRAVFEEQSVGSGASGGVAGRLPVQRPNSPPSASALSALPLPVQVEPARRSSFDVTTVAERVNAPLQRSASPGRETSSNEASGSYAAVAAPAPAPAAAAAPVLQAAPALSVLPPAAATVAVAVPSPPIVKVSMTDVQPVLASLVGAVQSGRGEDVLRALDGPARRSDGAAGFLQAYYRMKGPTRIVGLGPVRFRGNPSPDTLVVDGVIQLYLQDESQRTLTRDFHIRAHFVSRDGLPVLTQLSAIDPGQ